MYRKSKVYLGKSLKVYVLCDIMEVGSEYYDAMNIL